MFHGSRNLGRQDHVPRDIQKNNRSTDSNQRLVALVSPYQVPTGSDSSSPSQVSDSPLRRFNHQTDNITRHGRREEIQSTMGTDEDIHLKMESMKSKTKGDTVEPSPLIDDNNPDANDWYVYLQNTEKRDAAILELCKNSDVIDNIGCMLWRTQGTVAILLGELVKLYPQINPPSLPGSTIAKVCSITALLQRVVLEVDTRQEFLQSKIIMYLLPFLAVEGNTREVEHLRVCILSLLCTMARLLTSTELELHLELKQSEVFPLTLQTLKECISEVGRTMATILLSHLLRSDFIISLICHRRAVFSDIMMALNSSLIYISKRSHAPARAKRLLHFVILCLQQMAANDRLRQAMAYCLPMSLRDNRLLVTFQGDPEVYNWLFTLKEVLLMSPVPVPMGHNHDITGRGAYSRLAMGDSAAAFREENGRISNLWKCDTRH